MNLISLLGQRDSVYKRIDVNGKDMLQKAGTAGIHEATALSFDTRGT